MDFVVPLRQPMTTMRSPKTQKHDKSYLRKIRHPPHLTPWRGTNDTFLMLEDFCNNNCKIQKFSNVQIPYSLHNRLFASGTFKTEVSTVVRMRMNAIYTPSWPGYLQWRDFEGFKKWIS